MLMHFKFIGNEGRTACRIRLIFVKATFVTKDVTCSSCKETYEYNSVRYGRK